MEELNGPPQASGGIFSGLSERFNTVGTWLFHFILLSFLWFLSVLLVVPAGPAWPALFNGVKRLMEGDDVSMVKRFFADMWKYRWGGSAVFWAGVLSICFIILDIDILRSSSSFIASMVAGVLVIALAIVCSGFCMAFPLLIRFEGRLRDFVEELGMTLLVGVPRAALALVGSLLIIGGAVLCPLLIVIALGGLLAIWNLWNFDCAYNKLTRLREMGKG
jgi:uncharacterized membrane protein YesL